MEAATLKGRQTRKGDHFKHSPATREKMKASKRRRDKPQKRTGRVTITENDCRGPTFAVARYQEATTARLIANGYRYFSKERDRFTKVFHETQDWPDSKKPFRRIPTYDQNPIGTSARYGRAGGTARHLVDACLITEQQAAWINSTVIGGSYPSRHNQLLCAAVLDIENAVKRAGLKWINHLDILASASPEAQNARAPLSIPLPEIAWNFAGGRQAKTGLEIEPDAVFGIEYPEGRRFFFVEWDMGTENTKARDLEERTWPRKIIAYNAAAKGPVLRHLGIQKFYVLIMHPAQRRHGDIATCIKTICPGGSDIFCTQAYPPLPPYGSMPKPTNFHFATDWLRVGRDPINLRHV